MTRSERACYRSPMPTARRVDHSLFGNTGNWSVDQHTETIRIHGLKVVLQTSDGQTNDGINGSWSVTIAGGRKTQFPWCPPEEARAKAEAWARDVLEDRPPAVVDGEPEAERPALAEAGDAEVVP